MIKWFVKKYIKNYQDVSKVEVRKAYGVLSGVLGIICNVILFIVKLTTGLFMNSIAIISDAFNNLTDSGSSLITIIGANYSSKPPDEDHPYGHGRFEYVSSLIVSFIIFAVGLQLIGSSFDKIIHPDPVQFNLISIIILSLSVFIKFWMYSYNKWIGKTINSTLNSAAAKDSLNDVVATLGVIIGTIIGVYVDLPIDGIIGIIISGLIIYTGFSSAKDSVNFILGSPPDPTILDQIKTIIKESSILTNCHNLHIHDYGPGRQIGSMHVVVPATISVEDAHTQVHEMEEKIKNELGIEIVIHMDPSDDIDEKLSKKMN